MVSQKAGVFFVGVAFLLYLFLTGSLELLWTGFSNLWVWTALNWWWVLPVTAAGVYFILKSQTKQKLLRNANVDPDEAWRDFVAYVVKTNDRFLRVLVSNLLEGYFPPQVIAGDVQHEAGVFQYLFEQKGEEDFVPPRNMHRYVIVTLKAGAIPQPFSKSRFLGWANLDVLMPALGARKLGDVQFQQLGASDYKSWFMKQLEENPDLLAEMPIPAFAQQPQVLPFGK